MGISQHDPGQVLFVEELVEYTGAPQAICVGWESQRITRTGQTVLARLMRTQIGAYLCLLVGLKESSTKEQWSLPTLLSYRELLPSPAPPALSPKLVSLFPPCMSLVCFEQLPLCCESRASESIGKSLCVPFKICSTLVSSSCCTFTLWDLNPQLFS